MKAATGTMHHILDRHPEIAMSRGKEINYFLEGEDGSVFEPKYEDNFNLEKGIKVLGEASPRYSIYGYGEGVEARISKELPHAHIFYQVRNPVDRMVSHYGHYLRTNRIQTSFYEAVKNDPTFLETSNYPLYFERYQSYYRGRFHWLDFDEIKANPYKVAEQFISAFGLKGGILNTEVKAHFNVNDKVIPNPKTNPLAYRLYKFGKKNHKRISFVPKGLRSLGKSVLAGNKGINIQSAEFLKEVDKVEKEYYSKLEEIRIGCEELCGRDYSSWKK